MTQAREPSRFRPGSWDLGFALGIWLLFMVVMALGGLLLGGQAKEPGAGVLLAALPAQLFVILLVPLALRLRSKDWREEAGLYAPALPSLGRGLFDYLWVGPLWWAFAFSWQALVQAQWPEHEPSQDAMRFLQGILTGDSPLALQLTALFITTLGAAASEELLFRGLMQGALRRYVGKQKGALILGAFFGLIHMQPHLIDSAFVVIPLAFLGYLLSLVRENPGGLWACVLIHASNNGLAIVLELMK